MTIQRHPSTAGGRRGLLAVIACGAVVMLTACGTRLSDGDIRSAGLVAVNGTAPGASAAAGSAGAAATAPADAGGAVTGGAVAGGGSGGGVAAGGTTSGGGATRGGTTGGGTTTGGGSGGGTSGGTGPACTSQGAPVVIGQDGSFSGLVGQSTGNMRTGLSVWAKYINSIGGVQCHPVQLYQEDDSSDPSKASANVNDLVRNKHAVAIVGADTPIVIAALRSSAGQLGVPVVGGDLTATDWTQDANLYPSGGSALAVYAGAIGQAIKDTGHTKVGLIYCVEASICGVIHKNYDSMVKSVHGSVVFQQSSSLTQSTFTAECQNAKAAGAQVIFLAMDGSADQRIASSCSSVGCHPSLASAGIAASKNALNDSNIKADGLYIGTNEAPYVMTNSPALDTFHKAFQ